MSQYKDIGVGGTVYFHFAANTITGTAGDGATPLFSVRLAGAFVVTLSHQHAIRRHDDGANQWIRTRTPSPACGMKQRAVHPAGVVHHHFSANSPSTYSSAENGTRSSMPSPTPT